MNQATTTLATARSEALEMSRAHPASYITIASCFGWIVVRAQRLPVFAPSDYTDPYGRTGTYWKNGAEKRFSGAQRMADEMATPILS